MSSLWHDAEVMLKPVMLLERPTSYVLEAPVCCKVDFIVFVASSVEVVHVSEWDFHPTFADLCLMFLFILRHIFNRIVLMDHATLLLIVKGILFLFVELIMLRIFENQSAS